MLTLTLPAGTRPCGKDQKYYHSIYLSSAVSFRHYMSYALSHLILTTILKDHSTHSTDEKTQ